MQKWKALSKVKELFLFLFHWELLQLRLQYNKLIGVGNKGYASA